MPKKSEMLPNKMPYRILYMRLWAIGIFAFGFVIPMLLLSIALTYITHGSDRFVGLFLTGSFIYLLCQCWISFRRPLVAAFYEGEIYIRGIGRFYSEEIERIDQGLVAPDLASGYGISVKLDPAKSTSMRRRKKEAFCFPFKEITDTGEIQKIMADIRYV